MFFFFLSFVFMPCQNFFLVVISFQNVNFEEWSYSTVTKKNNSTDLRLYKLFQHELVYILFFHGITDLKIPKIKFHVICYFLGHLIVHSLPLIPTFVCHQNKTLQAAAKVLFGPKAFFGLSI